jgi:hypothetical protein
VALRLKVWALAALGVMLALATSGCGQSVVVEVAPARKPPYDGPLYVKVTTPPSDHSVDRTGAAGRVVQCDGEKVGDSSGEVYDGGEVGKTPAEGLKIGFDEYIYSGAQIGYRKAREEGDRVLYTYEVDNLVKEAVIVHRGRAVDGNVGWYVESWAACDPAEFPDSVTDFYHLQIWTDARGRRVPTTAVVSSPGPQHCNWEAMTFLTVGRHLGGNAPSGAIYVGNADPEYSDYFAERYRRHTKLAGNAIDTGYHRGDQHLWLSSDRKRAYVGTHEDVELWPRTTKDLLCA